MPDAKVQKARHIKTKEHRKGPILELKTFELVSVNSIYLISSEIIGSEPIFCPDLNFRVLEIVDL